MSIVVALKTDTGVWIGSDTMAINCQVKEHFGQKWVRCGKYLVGVAGQIRAKNLIQANAEKIAQCTSFADILDVVEAAVHADKWKPTENAGEPNRFSLELIVTDGDALISASGSFGYIECGSHAVIGSGTEAALGAAHAFEWRTKDQAETVLKSMIAAAIAINHNCGGVAVTEFIPNPKEPQMSDRPDYLAAAVRQFEAKFSAVDDFHIHDGGARTTQGTEFITVVPEMPTPYESHEACAEDWLIAALQSVSAGGVLLWRTMPRFLALAGGGFTIDSRFAVEDEVTTVDGVPRATRKPEFIGPPVDISGFATPAAVEIDLTEESLKTAVDNIIATGVQVGIKGESSPPPSDDPAHDMPAAAETDPVVVAEDPAEPEVT